MYYYNKTYFFTFYLELAQHRMDDAGNTSTTFYQTNMQPANWYKWFKPSSEKPNSEAPKDENEPAANSGDSAAPTDSKSDEGWTEVSSSCIPVLNTACAHSTVQIIL